MQRGCRCSRNAIVAALVPLLVIGCSETETEVVNPPRVIVSGEFAILAGQSVQLTATTAEKSDAGYTWSSSDPGIAKVSATGLVTGVVPGTATITATGTTTGLSGTYNVVVANAIPQQTAWLASGHADAGALPFNYWNGSGSIPSSCARCHSTPGFMDYLGDDGTAPFSVENAAPTGTLIGCQACHNASAQTLGEVRFPSTKVITGLGAEARCMTCHQGRESKSTVDTAISNAGVAAGADADVVTTALSFKNIHYFAAGATLNGARAAGGYEYAGKTYDWRFRHVPEKDSCIECHDPHSLEVKPSTCATCHSGVTSAADFRSIRHKSSLALDYDGDGNTTEGIAGEIDTLRSSLMTAVQSYVSARGLQPICYSGSAYPYFFAATPDSNGFCADADAIGANVYVQWNARLLRATFNYQFSRKDPGAFAHNAKYVIQLLFDATMDLNAGIAGAGGTPVDMTAMHRDDHGHFFGAGKPARYGWDTNGYVGVYTPCSKCHSGSEGFRFFVTYGMPNPAGVKEPGNGLDCTTCHTSFPASTATPNLVSVASVTFPSGKVVTPNPTAALDRRLTASSFICMTCHSGREAKSTQDAAIPAAQLADPDSVSSAVKFKLAHYLPAGAVLLGSEAAVGYEYTGKTYAGRDTHPLGIDCNTCHSGSVTKHTFQAADNLSSCYGCHGVPQPSSVEELRGSIFADDDFDYDGDGNVAEPLRDEVAGLAERLLVDMEAYATGHGGPICYDETHPHFRTRVGASCTTTAYTEWTARLVRAAFNYALVRKEPGAWAHNMTYISQLLYDSIEDLEGSPPTGLTRAP